MTKEEKVGSLRKLSQFNITKVLVFYTKTVNSFFHLCGCGHHHNRIDNVLMIAGILKADNNPVALYLGYYD